MNRHWLIAGLLLLLGTLAVTATYTRLSPTADEMFHSSCGMEWWKKGTYTREPLHPPLTRIMAAVLPFWAGAPIDAGLPNTHDAYLEKTMLMRLGELPFYLLCAMVVFTWSRRLFGSEAALWSLALFVSQPAVSAISGLAVTDMGYTAMFAFSLMAAVDWLKTPTPVKSMLLGASVGLMLCSKFSGLVQWPAAMGAILIAQTLANRKLPIGRDHLINGTIVATPILVLTIGLVYRFSFDAFFAGIQAAAKLNDHGFAIWLFNSLRNDSVWYFFPVVFFFKTPLPFHFTAILGGIKAWRSDAIEKSFPLVAALAILAASTISNINLGVRHVLPMYPLLAIPAGFGLWWLWQQRSWKRPLAALLLAGQVAGFAASYPDYLSYYNLLGGDHPERISLDSDFDWGQGVIQLNDVVQARDIESIYFCPRPLNISGWNAKMLLQTKVLACPTGPINGWLAVSRAHRLMQANNFTWLDAYQAVQPVGATLDLYFIPKP